MSRLDHATSFVAGPHAPAGFVAASCLPCVELRTPSMCSIVTMRSPRGNWAANSSARLSGTARKAKRFATSFSGRLRTIDVAVHLAIAGVVEWAVRRKLAEPLVRPCRAWQTQWYNCGGPVCGSLRGISNDCGGGFAFASVRLALLKQRPERDSPPSRAGRVPSAPPIPRATQYGLI